MKKFLLILLLTVGAQAFAGHHTKSFLIQFATDEHSLDPSALQKLNEVTAYLKSHPNARVSLTGRTDYDGTVGYNMALSRRRTTEVAAFLKTKGWQNAEINEKWVGELKPIATNANDDGKALNRSVEILITTIDYKDAAEWMQEKQDASKETFTLKSSGKNIITTDNQTIITIPSGAFTTSDGKAIDNKNVNVVIKEVNTKMDAIINQVYTMSGDKLLETGGMMNMEAYSNNTKLELADGKQISIKIPTQTVKNDMFVFTGVADNTGKIDWVNTGNRFATNEQKNKKSIKLNEEILKELIDGIDNTPPQAFVDFKLTYTLPKFVNVPTMPRLPKTPVRPEAKSLFSTLGWLLATKKMKEKRVEKVYKANMAEHERRMAIYTKRLAKYELAMERQKTEIEAFEAEKALFYDWLRQTRHSVTIAMSNIFDNHDKLRASRGLKTLYNNSKNDVQYSQKPLAWLRNFARTTRLSEEENMKLEYLLGIQKSISRFQSMDYAYMARKYARSGKLRIFKVHKSEVRMDLLRTERLWTNQFLDNYIAENKATFTEVFPEEIDGQMILVSKQNQLTKQIASTEYFTGSVSKMGWINCDRFVSNQLVRVAFTRLPGAYQAVIVNSLNSVLNTSYYNNSGDMTFAQVPVNEKFRLVTLKIEGDQAWLSIMEATAQADMRLVPDFKKMPIEEVDKVLAKL